MNIILMLLISCSNNLSVLKLKGADIESPVLDVNQLISDDNKDDLRSLFEIREIKKDELYDLMLLGLKKQSFESISVLIEKGANIYSAEKGESPISFAMKIGEYDLLEKLMKSEMNANVNRRLDTKDKDELFRVLLSLGDRWYFNDENIKRVVGLLIENNTLLNFLNKLLNISFLLDQFKCIAMRLAIDKNRLDLCVKLLKDGFNCNLFRIIEYIENNNKLDILYRLLTNKKGFVIYSGKSMSFQKYASKFICISQFVDLLKVYGEYFLEYEDKDGITLSEYMFINPLHLSVCKGIREELSRILDKNVYDIDARIINKSTALHLAVTNKDKEVCEILLNGGADVNARDNFGITPLHLAVTNKDKEVCEILLNGGADVNIRDTVGITSLHYAVGVENDKIVTILLERGAYVNARDIRGITPLYDAVSVENDKIVTILLERGAYVSIGDNFGITPLQYAQMMKNQTIIDILTKAKAAEKINRSPQGTLSCAGFDVNVNESLSSFRYEPRVDFGHCTFTFDESSEDEYSIPEHIDSLV